MASVARGVVGAVGALLAALLLVACAPAAPVGTAAARSDPCEAAPPGFVHGVTAVPGARLHRVLGGHGPAVVLVHGFPETWATWRPVMARLARDHTVVAVDLRGIGCSSPEPDGYDTDTLAGDLAALTAEERLGRVTVVGHDMGAMTAYAWARARPDQVDHLVLTGAGLPGLGLEEGAPPHVAAFAADPGAVERAAAPDLRGFLARFVGDPAVEASGALDAAVRAHARPGRLGLALRQYAALPRDAVANRAHVTDGPFPPTLALEGGAPGLTLASLRRAGVPAASAVLPGAGHYAQVDRPDAYADAVARFAGSRSPTTSTSATTAAPIR